MAYTNINSSLNKPGIVRESVYGVPFAGTIYPLFQSFDSPITVDDNYSKEVIKTTQGSQVQFKNTQIMGQRNCSASWSNSIGNNDFLFIGGMFFQNGYTYTAKQAQVTVSVIGTYSAGTYTLTFATAPSLIVGDVIIVNETVAPKTSIVTITAVNSGSKTISFKAPEGDTGTWYNKTTVNIKSLIDTHSSYIEDCTLCSRQDIESSYTLSLPNKFRATSGLCGNQVGEQYYGVIPKSLSIDFANATYNVSTIGKGLLDISTVSGTAGFPESESDYETFGNEVTYMRKNSPILKRLDDTLAPSATYDVMDLSINIDFNVEDSLKTRRAGELARAVVDGVNVSGSLSMLYLTADDANNISNTLFKNRSIDQSGGLYSFGLNNPTDGSEVSIIGYAKFKNEKVTKAVGGWMLTVDFDLFNNASIAAYKGIQLIVKNALNNTAVGTNNFFKSLV